MLLLFIPPEATAVGNRISVGASFSIEDIDDTPRMRDIQDPEWLKFSLLDLREVLDEVIEEEKSGLIVYFGQMHCAYGEAPI